MLEFKSEMGGRGGLNKLPKAASLFELTRNGRLNINIKNTIKCTVRISAYQSFILIFKIQGSKSLSVPLIDFNINSELVLFAAVYSRI
jgi:hypothetical protein